MMKIGYARCSTNEQDVEIQKEALLKAGVDSTRIYCDIGVSGARKERSGLEKALAAVRAGDELVVTRLDRLGRSFPDLRTIADGLDKKGVTLVFEGHRYDPNDPIGKMFFSILAVFAEVEREFLRMRTREGMEKARLAGRLKGRQPKLNERKQDQLMKLIEGGNHSVGEIAEIFGVSRPTVYRVVGRRRVQGKDA